MIYVIGVLFLVLFIISKSPKLKGLIGEKSVTYKLKNLDKSKYIVINNIIIPSTSGRTTQIDHVVVSIYGLFVVETKNYRGWIVGDERSEYWTQVIYKRKEKLYNPLRQNYGHVKAIAELFLEYGNLPIVPIVSFSGRADIKVKTTQEVVNASKLLKTIEKFNEIRLSIEQVNQIVTTLKANHVEGNKASKKHVLAKREVAATKQAKIASGVCPRCGSELVDRFGRYGKFKGCNGYPKCKYVFKN